MAQLMLEYWDKQNWNESVAEDPTMAAALNHGALEGAHTMHKRVSHCYCFQRKASEQHLAPPAGESLCAWAFVPAESPWSDGAEHTDSTVASAAQRSRLLYHSRLPAFS